MTTHETQPEMVDTTPGVNRDQMDRGPAHASAPEFSERSAAATSLDDPGREPMGEQPVAQPQGVPVSQESVRDDPMESTAPAGATDQMLFGDGELSAFHSRWTEVQAAFVDDPRDCVQKADGLVSDVVDRLTAGFASARSALEEQWSRGEQVSTEDLRLALQRYRDFFERLLAI
jgi:hypothetical protein